jgi:hypothetical protein
MFSKNVVSSVLIGAKCGGQEIIHQENNDWTGVAVWFELTIIKPSVFSNHVRNMMSHMNHFVDSLCKVFVQTINFCDSAC